MSTVDELLSNPASVQPVEMRLLVAANASRLSAPVWVTGATLGFGKGPFSDKRPPHGRGSLHRRRGGVDHKGRIGSG